MKNITCILSTIVSSAALSIFANTSPAQALNFKFYLSNFSGNVNGTVTGKIIGLTDNTTSSAEDVIVTSYPSGFTGLPGAPFSVFSSPFGYIVYNSFTVSDTNITAVKFQAQDSTNSKELSFNGFGDIVNALRDSTKLQILYNHSGFIGVTYTYVPVPFDIPGGATIPSIGTLLALGVMRKFKKSRLIQQSNSCHAQNI